MLGLALSQNTQKSGDASLMKISSRSKQQKFENKAATQNLPTALIGKNDVLAALIGSVWSSYEVISLASADDEVAASYETGKIWCARVALEPLI